MEDMFRFADALGPAKIVHIHVTDVGLKVLARTRFAGECCGRLQVH